VPTRSSIAPVGDLVIVIGTVDEAGVDKLLLGDLITQLIVFILNIIYIIATDCVVVTPSHRV